ncbi:MAG: RHS repeat-associated core domain-containing protein [Brachymonas sp.]
MGLPETGGADQNQVAQETWRIEQNLHIPPVLNIRYPGQYYDFESGLVQNWWRTYEPRIGRYVSADPIGLEGGWNRFSYAGQDGINGFDRDGRLSVAAFAIAAIGFSVAINDTVDAYCKGKAEACNRAVLERIKKQYENSCRKPTSELSASDLFVINNNPKLIRSSAMMSGYSALSQILGSGLDASTSLSESRVHGSGVAKSPINFLPSPIAYQYGVSSGCELLSGDL